MQVEILGKKGRTLKTVTHEGVTYVEAPESGEYKIRLRNTSASRRLTIVSVDGVNVLDGKDAGFDGQGYVLRPWETIDIPGWRRSDSTVAKFQFKEQGGSYAAQTGRGTSNVGVIGVAVYDEKVQTYVPVVVPLVQPMVYPWQQPCGTVFDNTVIGCNQANDNMKSAPVMDTVYRSRSAQSQAQTLAAAMGFDALDLEQRRDTQEQRTSGSIFNITDVGTAYGQESTFHTHTTQFIRATRNPALVMSLRYATYQRLKSWGVPIENAQPAQKSPNPFPMSQPSVPAPPNWRG